MFKFFSIDSPVFAFLSRVADIIITSVMWTIFCLPIFTIGAATTAMYRVMFNMAFDKGGSSIIKQFWDAFRSDFIISSKVFLAALPAYALIGVDIWCLFNLNLLQTSALLCLISAVLIGICVQYVFPLTSQFDNTVGHTLRNAFLLAISRPLRSLLILTINLLPLIFYLVKPGYFFYSIVLWPMLGFGLIARINASIYKSIFRPLIEEQNNN